MSASLEGIRDGAESCTKAMEMHAEAPGGR